MTIKFLDSLIIMSDTQVSSYPEWTVGYIDLTPGDDNGVFDGFCRDVDAKESAITIVCNLDVNRITFRVLKKKSQIQNAGKEKWISGTSLYPIIKCNGNMWKMANKIILRFQVVQSEEVLKVDT